MPAVDTIFALSSGAPPAAIAIIRISGSRAFEAVEMVAGRIPPVRRASLSALRNPATGEEIDRALVLIFPGPNSASGEDLAELHLHGGRAVVRAVESALAAINGLRRADPGEFTRRAFANGRIDLNEAEGLADLLAAETEWQRRASVSMASGAFSKAIEGWRNDILGLSALVEAELDFSDEGDVDEQNNNLISNGCVSIFDTMTALLGQPAAEKLRDGVRVVIGGPPNSGKSTLLNALVDREAAIVSEIAGTTRDLIEVPVAFGGIPLLLIDSAGVRDVSEDSVEAVGIERAHAAFGSADILLWLGAEGDGPLHPNRFEIEAKLDDPRHALKTGAAIRISAKTGAGLSELIDAIVDAASQLLPPPDHYAVNARQRALIADAADALAMASQEEDWLIVAEQLRQVRLALDALTGRAHTEDMLDALFDRFCVGK